MRRGFDLVPGHGGQDNLHRAKRTGHHAGFTADTFLLVDLYAVVKMADSAIGATAGAGSIFTVAAGHRAALVLMFDDGYPRLVVTLAQDVLLIIVGHNASHFTGMASQALLAVGHNKTIHGDLLFWL